MTNISYLNMFVSLGSVLPLSSLRLLVPPLRLMSAFMWQAVQQQKVEHFKKLEEYVQLITKMVPEILTNRQKTTLIMGLRAKGSSQEACTDLAQGTPPAKRPSGECRFCGQMFSEIELRSHLKTHPEFRPHQCDHCGKCLASLHGLLAHISNHTGDKPHVCVSCGKRFFSQSQLKSHMKSHSKERRFCCSYCGKCFLSAGNLNIHVRMHTGEKPYVCTECGKAFKSAGCLQVHRRCHTGEKPYQCT
ncbi:hypothetical protein P4O66_014399, partial [Electrophorus voltai]